MRRRARPASLTLSMVSILAALNVIGDFVPLTPIIGFEQSRLTLGWAFASLTGLMLGPLFGATSCLIASLAELFLGFPLLIPFGPLGLVRSALAAFQTGLFSTRRWVFSGGILLILIISWLLTPQGKEAMLVLAFHLFGLVLMLVSRSWVADALESHSRRQIGLAVAIACYCGNISRHLFGNLLFVFFASLPAVVFLTAMPLTLLEQTFFALLSGVLGASLVLLGLRRVTYLG
jgi:hypothetical protein